MNKKVYCHDCKIVYPNVYDLNCMAFCRECGEDLTWNDENFEPRKIILYKKYTENEQRDI